MTIATNVVKRAAAQKQRIRGFHLTFAEPAIIEIMAAEGMDFVYLDGEHGSFGTRDIEACCVAAERWGLTPIARVPDRRESTITAFLDRGVQGLVVPHVESRADALEVLRAAYYAPLGERSFGAGRPHYGLRIDDQVAHIADVNANTSVCIMIESVAGLEAAEQIAAMEGVDYLSFGLNDLSQSMGLAGRPGSPEVSRAVAECSQRIYAAGKPVREDFMSFAWIKDIIVAGTRELVR